MMGMPSWLIRNGVQAMGGGGRLGGRGGGVMQARRAVAHLPKVQPAGHALSVTAS